MHTILSAQKNPALRGISRELTAKELGSTKTKKLIAEMKKLLAKEEFGVALAAVQLGEPVRLFLVSGRALARGSRNAQDEPDKRKELAAPLPPTQGRLAAGQDQVYINPVLVKLSRKKEQKHEGCLSIRGKWGQVPRAEKATLRYTDEHGVRRTRGASGFLAHIFQHEMDHLEGILYTDKATKLYDEQNASSAL